MVSSKPTGDDFEVLAEELTGQIRALVGIGGETNGLVSTARLLAERQPPLGTAPPALQLAMRLLEAAGPSGLTGEVSAADTELASYHRALDATVRHYQSGETEASLRFTDEETST
ncbi:hypothetical protein BLA60_29635 [Actinophytocola xinjiangensis]|uniref:Excreted virulence factor EspC (Type VII ESX diderm) n=1 Tax=Actinophytocola xinjiangensis TaxID=485602 RepID=A0A7Z1AWX1_9PSEU|nr:hypothetical protein BLA60_29635 [Actinophytocola xinjiangensis]